MTALGEHYAIDNDNGRPQRLYSSDFEPIFGASRRQHSEQTPESASSSQRKCCPMVYTRGRYRH